MNPFALCRSHHLNRIIHADNVPSVHGLARYHSFFAKVDLAAMEPQLADNPEHLIGVIRGLSHLVTANRALKQKQASHLHLKDVARTGNSSARSEPNGGLAEEERGRVAWELGIRPPQDMLPTTNQSKTGTGEACATSHP